VSEALDEELDFEIIDRILAPANMEMNKWIVNNNFSSNYAATNFSSNNNNSLYIVI
jgi:hypothetical protein